jgi:hypothetical protein
MENMQRAPHPDALDDLIGDLHYKAGWNFELHDMNRGQNSSGLTLDITIRTPDSYDEDRQIEVHHLFPVPPAAYDARSWRRWLFEQILLVERHEAMEFFRFPIWDWDDERCRSVEIVERPYAPSHGPGNDPYVIRELGTTEDQHTTFRGERF